MWYGGRGMREGPERALPASMAEEFGDGRRSHVARGDEARWKSLGETGWWEIHVVGSDDGLSRRHATQPPSPPHPRQDQNATRRHVLYERPARVMSGSPTWSDVLGPRVPAIARYTKDTGNGNVD